MPRDIFFELAFCARQNFSRNLPHAQKCKINFDDEKFLLIYVDFTIPI